MHLPPRDGGEPLMVFGGFLLDLVVWSCVGYVEISVDKGNILLVEVDII